ncbi:MAG: hypothetical protein HYR88_15050, partial [Verrucomicrobia bacterium]|nr:hypothetical protein [Verrucomicrobiota bacterium]
FKGTLVVNNRTATAPLTGIAVRVDFFDADQAVANERFAYAPPTLSGVTAVDGSGVIGAASSGSVEYTFIPTTNAAPNGPAAYQIGGELRYTEGSNFVVITLNPAPITVLPQASLKVDYFHQRDVFSDDPFTPQIEPSIPYSLAVMLKNQGRGAAHSVRITSAQPKIVDSDKGLLIDFQIVATEVAGVGLTPSLTAEFGEIPPGGIAIGRWLLKSSLQGLFIDYAATFEHVNGLGRRDLSLIDSVNIHEMIHQVNADRVFADGLPDFLVNEIPDVKDDPDTLYLSDGRVMPVTLATGGAAGAAPTVGRLETQFTATFPPGWGYVRVPDPANGELRLVGVRRADGSTLSEDNFWVTDRTFVGLGRRPVRENVLHLLEYEGRGSYTLVYAPPTPVDITPPTSAVTALSANSPARFLVNWSGVDPAQGSGLASFDIFVSVDGGAFALWRQGANGSGAVYSGSLGHRYAFYSIATDAAGNRESAPATPDAETFANLVNTAPVIGDAPTQVVDEGDLFRFAPTVTDADQPPQTLTWSLVEAPLGAVVNPASGVVTWLTGESHGPSTNTFTLNVSDNGSPSLSDEITFAVIVNEVNTPPALALLAGATIREGQLMVVTNVASDFDLPAQRLSYRLGPGAPAGASIDSATGVFRWRPAEFQGGTNYLIAMIVSDDGLPSLSATQTLSVVVRDVRSDFLFTVGSTNAFMGDSGFVPLQLVSSADLTNLTFVLDVDESRLSGLSVQSLAPGIGSSFQPMGANHSQIRFTAGAGAPLHGPVTLGRLNFAALSNAHSAIVPLTALGVEGAQDNGALLTRPGVVNGRVFVLGDEPLLYAREATNGARSLVLYGRPDGHYVIESNRGLSVFDPWALWRELDLSGPYVIFEDVERVDPKVFYRAYRDNSGGGLVAGLSARRQGGQLVIEWPATLGDCVLLETASVAHPTWSPVSPPPQLAGGVYSTQVPIAGGTRFYRLRCSR